MERGSGSVLAHPLFRAVFDGAFEAMTLVEDDGRIVDINPACCTLLGRDKADLVGRHFLELAVPAETDPAEVWDRLREVGHGSGRVRLRRADGSLRDVEFQSQMNVEPGLHFSAGRDVTERLAAERSLREMEHRLQTLVSTAPVILAAFDRDGLITLSLGKGLDALGVAQGELEGQNVYEHYGALPGVHELLEQVWNGKPHSWQGAIGEAHLEAHLFPTTSSRGDVTGALAIAIDVTDRQRAEIQLLQSQKMEAIATLAGGVAHDFNNLLSVILSYASMLSGELDPGDPRHDDVAEIARAGERAAKLTRQLLALGRQQQLQPRVLGLNDVVRDLEQMLRRYVGEHVVMTLVPGSRLDAVEADPGQLEQVLVNLVVNARDAMPEGGTLTITTDAITVDESTAGQLDCAPGRYVRLSVRDTGVGMDPETRARIFEPFFSTKHRGQGSGLGLSTVFGIVRQSNGFVTVESELGRGTVFHVCLPATASALGPVSLHTPFEGSLEGAETLLLVEDEEPVRAVLAAGLRRHGYQVMTAQNAGEALLLSEQHDGTIHLLVTDVVMPYMSGPSLAARLTRDRPGMGVLFITGYADHEALPRDSVSAGRLLTKPFAPDALVRRVRELLDG